MKASFYAATILLLAGCSSQQVYDSTQSLRVQDCEKLSISERDACLVNARTPYSEHAKRIQE